MEASRKPKHAIAVKQKVVPPKKGPAKKKPKIDAARLIRAAGESLVEEPIDPSFFVIEEPKQGATPVPELKDGEDSPGLPQFLEQQRFRESLRLMLGDTHVEQVFKVPMAFWFQLTSSAGGLVSSFASNDPTNSPSWGAAAALFNQYRVVSYKFTYLPMFVVNAVTDGPAGVRPVSPQGIFTYIDEDDPTTFPTSVVDAMEHADTLRVSSGYELSVKRSATPVYSLASNPDDTWNDCAAPAAASQSIKLVGNHSLLSTVVANCVIEWMVEFRGLGA
jgi:hypothetical protein